MDEIAPDFRPGERVEVSRCAPSESPYATEGVGDRGTVDSLHYAGVGDGWQVWVHLDSGARLGFLVGSRAEHDEDWDGPDALVPLGLCPDGHETSTRGSGGVCTIHGCGKEQRQWRAGAARLVEDAKRVGDGCRFCPSPRAETVVWQDALGLGIYWAPACGSCAAEQPALWDEHLHGDWHRLLGPAPA